MTFAEALEVAKIVGVSGSGLGFMVWVFAKQLPAMLQGWKDHQEWKLKHQAQSADQFAARTRLLTEREVAINNEQRIIMTDMRAEITSLREDVEDWMAREHNCREEVHTLRNEVHGLSLQAKSATDQLSAMSAMNDRSASLLRALNRVHPEWFGNENPPS